MFSRDQYLWLRNVIAPSMQRFLAIQKRLDCYDRRTDPEVIAQVERVADELHKLAVLTHYRSCDGGVAGADTKGGGDHEPPPPTRPAA